MKPEIYKTVAMLENLLKAKKEELEPHFKPGFLQRENTVFQFEFEDDAAFYLKVSSSDFEFNPGHWPAPTISLFVLDHLTCWGLLDGSIDGMKAFMDETYRADGNIVLSQLLLYLFKSNDPTIVYEVQY